MFAGAPVGSPPERQRDKRRPADRAADVRAVARYPGSPGLPAHWGWEQPVVTTPDGIPWIGPHRNYPFHFFALAFGWHGDALAWLAAKAALRQSRGEPGRRDASGFVRYL